MDDRGEHMEHFVKYVLVTGGTLRGIGKSVVAASIGMILKASGLDVTVVSINPYFNVHADNFDLYTHGEVFVLDDGGLVDMDAGIFERFLGIDLPSINCLTSGKIYDHIIRKERRNKYNGETVRMRSHVTHEIIEWIKKASLGPASSTGQIPDVCVIELGSLIEDIETKPYLEALKQLKLQVKHENMSCIHISWLPQVSLSNEPQTKATELTVEELRRCGLGPDVVICRCEDEPKPGIKRRISEACLVNEDQVIVLPVQPSVYHIPVVLKNAHLNKFLCEQLGLCVPSPRPRQLMTKWRALASRYDKLTRGVNIALIGKYAKYENSYVSLRKAIEHAELASNCKVHIKTIFAEDLEAERKEKEPAVYFKAWDKICKSDAIIVPGGNGPKGIEGKITVINWAREFKKPFLGIGLGFHCAVIEFARNVLNWKNANTAEVVKDNPVNVIVDMPELRDESGSKSVMKLGKRQTVFKGPKSVLKMLYSNRNLIEERHCHWYDVNPKYVLDLESAGLHFSAHDDSGLRMDALEISDLPYFVAVQFHPEYSSRPLRPAPPILGLILAASGKLNEFFRREFLLSPRYMNDGDSNTSERDNLSMCLFDEENEMNREGSNTSLLTIDDM